MPYFAGPNGLQQVADPGQQVMDGFKTARRSKLISDYFRTGHADLGQLAKFDPEAAQQIQEREQKKGLAQMLGEAYNAPEDQRQGLLARMMSQDPTMGMAAAKMLDPRFTQNQAEQYTLAPGSARYSPDGRLIVERPFAPQGFKGTWDSERGMWIPQPGGQPQQAGQPGMGQQGGGSQVLDDALVNAVMQQESGGNPNAVSSAGARGLMQIMPGTAKSPGFGISPMQGDSPEENMRVGREYLNAMLGRYKGDQTLALAAYNAGPGRVDQALASAGGDAQRAISMLPQETQNYVRQVPARMGQQGETQGGGLRAITVDGVGPKQKFQSQQYGKAEIAAMGLPPGTVAYTTEDGTPKIVNKPDAASTGEKPIPVQALAKLLDTEEALSVAEGLFSNISKHLGRLGDGSLKVSTAGNAKRAFNTFANRTDENDVNYNELIADRTKIVNDSMRLNNGVQTEGDAKRSADEIMNSNDQATTVRALIRLLEINKRGMELQRKKQALVNQNYGRGQQSAPKPQGGGLSAQEQAELAALRKRFGR